MRPILALALPIMLGGCFEQELKLRNYVDEKLETELIRPPPSASYGFAPAAPALQPAEASGEPRTTSSPRNIAVAVGLPMLAYSYKYGVHASPDGVRSLVAGHEKACRDAGPATCQVLRSILTEQGEDRVTGSLSMRAEASWLTRFREGLAGQARSAGGRIDHASIETEDLSRQIVDTEARIRAMTTLRDRLQALLASRPGKLGELLDTERELAAVQGDIDSAVSQLTMMRARVATSAIDLTYQSVGVVAPQGVFAPIRQAVEGFVSLLVQVVAFLITALAALAPFALILGAAGWAFRKRITAGLASSAAPKEPPLVLAQETPAAP